MKPTEIAIRKALPILCETFARELTSSLVSIYVEALGDLSEAEVHLATKRAIASLKWFPRPAELRELVRTTQQAMTLEERATRAYTLCAKELDFYKTCIFDDPVIHATVRALGGVEAFLESDERFYRPQFLKAYSAFAKSGVTEGEAAPLWGFFDQENDRDDNATGHEPTLRHHKRISTGLPLLPSCANLKLTYSRPSRAVSATAINFKEAAG